MGLTVGGNLVIQFHAILYDISVVFLHETALGHVIVGNIREPGVLPSLLEPIVRFLELLAGVVDVAHRIP